MEELGKALAEAVRTGTQLAWPALVLYVITKALTPVMTAGAFLGSVWLITRAALRFPLCEAKGREALTATRIAERANEYEHETRMRALKRT